jgi:predicted chitinase
MKVYQAFTIDTSYLPSNYPNSLEFLIKGVTHTIQNNEWLTQMDSMAVPKNPFGSGGKEDSAVQTRPSVNTGTPVSTNTTVPQSKKGIVEKIVKLAKSLGITDRERLTAILAVAQAETAITPSLDESFLYSLDSAKKVFPGRLKGLTDAQIKALIPKSKGGTGSEKALADYLYSPPSQVGGFPKGTYYGNKAGEGYKFRGQGLTQITFKGNFDFVQKNIIDKNNIQYNGAKVDLNKNPELVLTEDVSVALLVYGKKDGVFGEKLVPNNPEYLSSGIAIEATQNGGKRKLSGVTAGYAKAAQTINNTKWIQDLIS